MANPYLDNFSPTERVTFKISKEDLILLRNAFVPKEPKNALEKKYLAEFNSYTEQEQINFLAKLGFDSYINSVLFESYGKRLILQGQTRSFDGIVLAQQRDTQEEDQADMT